MNRLRYVLPLLMISMMSKASVCEKEVQLFLSNQFDDTVEEIKKARIFNPGRGNRLFLKMRDGKIEQDGSQFHSDLHSELNKYLEGYDVKNGCDAGGTVYSSEHPNRSWYTSCIFTEKMEPVSADSIINLADILDSYSSSWIRAKVENYFYRDSEEEDNFEISTYVDMTQNITRRNSLFIDNKKYELECNIGLSLRASYERSLLNPNDWSRDFSTRNVEYYSCNLGYNGAFYRFMNGYPYGDRKSINIERLIQLKSLFINDGIEHFCHKGS